LNIHHLDIQGEFWW